VKAREALGDTVVLGVDYHHRLRSPRRRRSARRCRAARSTSSRSRSATRRPRPTSRCARWSTCPFAIGEEFSSKWQFLPYIERGLHQFNRIDICNVGGFTEAMKVAGWSEAHYVDLMPHNPLGRCAPRPRSLRRRRTELLLARCRSTPTEALGFDDRELFPEAGHDRRRRATSSRRARSRSRGRRGEAGAAGIPLLGGAAPALGNDGSYTNW
jgi:galactonate dehydratase